MIGRIGKVLRFEAQPGVPAIPDPAFSLELASQRVGGIKLEARLGGENLHHSPARGVGQDCDPPQSRPVQHVVVIESAWHSPRFADTRADPARLAKVERRSGHRGQLAGRDPCFVERCIPIGVQRKLVSDLFQLATEISG